jgi:hypothetical protein
MSSNGDVPTVLIPREDLRHLIAETAPDEAFEPPPATWLVFGIVAVLASLFFMIVTSY